MELNERMVRVEEKLSNIESKLDDFINSADNKYAPRWIINILSWVAGILGVVVTAGIVKALWGG